MEDAMETDSMSASPYSHMISPVKIGKVKQPEKSNGSISFMSLIHSFDHSPGRDAAMAESDHLFNQADAARTAVELEKHQADLARSMNNLSFSGKSYVPNLELTFLPFNKHPTSSGPPKAAEQFNQDTNPFYHRDETLESAMEKLLVSTRHARDKVDHWAYAVSPEFFASLLRTPKGKKNLREHCRWVYWMAEFLHLKRAGWDFALWTVNDLKEMLTLLETLTRDLDYLANRDECGWSRQATCVYAAEMEKRIKELYEKVTGGDELEKALQEELAKQGVL